MRGPVYFEGNKDSRLPKIFNRAGFIFDANGHGLQIMTVLPGTPGALAGLQTGDVITSVNGETPADDINQPVFLQPPGTELHLTVQRRSNTLEVSLKLKDIL
jgi:S1-C subfamily serine protease